MDRAENAAKSIRKQTTMCLAKAIGLSMRAAYGDQWFERVRKEDEREEKPILKGKERFSECDFQALVKLLCFREPCRHAVLSFCRTSIPVSEQKGKLEALLKRLINYRNDLDAHEAVGDVARQIKGEDLKKLYGYEEAINDMVKLTEVFACVTDEQGVSYYARTQKIRSDYREQSKLRAYPIAKVAAQQGMDVGEFINICRALRIDIRTVRNELCFVTPEYERTVYQIKSFRQASQSAQRQEPASQPVVQPTAPKRRHTAAWIAGIAAACLIAGLIVFLVMRGRTQPAEAQTTDNATTAAPDVLHQEPTAAQQKPVSTPVPTDAPTPEPAVTSAPAVAEPEPTAEPKTPDTQRIRASAEFQGLKLFVDQTYAQDGKIRLRYQNDSTYTFAMGWVSSMEFDLETTEDFYHAEVYRHMGRIYPGDSDFFELSFDGAKGDPVSLNVKNIIPLVNGGPADISRTYMITLKFGEGAASDAGTETQQTVRLKGEAAYQGLTFTVDQTYRYDGKIVLQTANGDRSMNRGWVNKIGITLETTDGSFTTQLPESPYRINPQQEDLFTIYFDGAAGTPVKLYVDGVVVLNDRGLPADMGSGKTVEIPLTVE